MIIRKTSKTIKKKIYRNRYDLATTVALYRKVTYWFLFVPVYSYDVFID